MKRAVLLILILCSPALLAAQIGIYQRGTIVRMHMGDCIDSHHGFMAAFGGGPAQQQIPEVCPEYTLVTDKVVYVIVGKSSNHLLPLAETTNFRFRKNELLVRVDDESHEARFQIKEMVLRPEWDRNRAREEEEETSAPARHRADPAIAMRKGR